MKKVFTFLCLWAVAAIATTAQAQYQGSAPAAGTFYLYNVGTGTWLGENWTNSAKSPVQAELSSRGLDFDLVAQTDGTYEIQPKMGGNNNLYNTSASGSNLYLNQSAGNSYWYFTLVDGATDTYTMYSLNSSNNPRYFGTDSSGHAYTDTNSSNVYNQEWKLVTREDRIAYEKSIASEHNPVDMSWLILGGTFPTGTDTRYTDTSIWQGTRSSNGNHGGFESWDDVWELYYISSNLNIYQELQEVPNGTYRMTAQGVYSPTRDTGMSYDLYEAYINGNDPTRGYFYANDTYDLMANAYSFATESQTTANGTELKSSDEGKSIFVPHSTAQFDYYMEQGQATTTLDFEVDEGYIKVGFYVAHSNDEFIVIDNFCLYYYGDGSNEDLYTFSPDDYYMYNVGTGMWLGENYQHTDMWTTHAELSPRGLDFTFTTLSNGTWRINPRFGGSEYLHADRSTSYDLYLDYYADTDVTPWLFTLVEGTEDEYYVTASVNDVEYVLGADSYGRPTTNPEKVVSGTDTWKLYTRAERIAEAVATATGDNPVDMSWLIKDGTRANGDSRSSNAWTTTGVAGTGHYTPSLNAMYGYTWEYYGITTGGVYQTISDAPDGVYKLNAYATYCPLDGANRTYDDYLAYQDDSQPGRGVVYVNDGEAPMPNTFDLTSTTSETNYKTYKLNDDLYTYSGYNEVANSFYSGMIITEYATGKATDGKGLTVGAKTTNEQVFSHTSYTTGRGWMLMKDFYMYYYGTTPATTGEFTITDAGYATYYTDVPYIMPDGVIGTTVTAVENETEEDGGRKLTMAWEYDAGSTVPANTALVLKGEAGTYTYYTDANNSDAAPEGNLLGGYTATYYANDGTTFGPDDTTNYFFVLSYGTDDLADTIGFFYGNDYGTTFKSEPNKAWLTVPQADAMNVKFFSLLGGGDAPDGINSVTAAGEGTSNGPVYNLQGVRVNDMSRKGIYIVDGKKVIVK